MIQAETVFHGLEYRKLKVLEENYAQQRSRDTARFCENENCSVLKLTGERQKLSIYNLKDEEGLEERLCRRCRSEGVVLPRQERGGRGNHDSHKKKDKCVNEHVIAEAGRYSTGQCKACHKERKSELNRMKKAARLLEEYSSQYRFRERHLDVKCKNLASLKTQSGKTYEEIAQDLGINRTRLNAWAKSARAPWWAPKVLAVYFGVTEEEVLGEPK